MRSILTQRRALALVAVLAVVGGLLPAAWSAKVTGRLGPVVRLPISPFTDLLQKLGGAVRGGSRPVEFDDATRLADDYAAGLVYQRQLEDALADAREQILQLAQIRRRGEFVGPALQTANVVSGPSFDSPTITINRGRKHGVRENLAVAQGFNLVGRVSEAGPVTATVKLILAKGTRLDVRLVPPTPGQAPLEESAQLELTDDGRRFFCIVSADSPVKAGDLAHLSDDYWPPEARGLIVGQVHAVEKDPNDPTLRRRVTVEPLPALRHLTRVVVFVPVEAE